MKKKVCDFLQDVHVFYKSLSDPEVPAYIKILVGLIIAYILSPIDIIPDFIPVLGLLDEVILIPLAIKLAIRLMPEGRLETLKVSVEKVEFSGIFIVTGVSIRLWAKGIK